MGGSDDEEAEMQETMMDTGDVGDDYGLSQSAPSGEGSSRSSRRVSPASRLPLQAPAHQSAGRSRVGVRSAAGWHVRPSRRGRRACGTSNS